MRFVNRNGNIAFRPTFLEYALTIYLILDLVHKVKENVPRFLINREPVGPFRFYQMDCCFRDVVYLGNCDDGVKKLCDLIGWREELEDLYTKGRAKLEKTKEKFLELKSSFQQKLESAAEIISEQN